MEDEKIREVYRFKNGKCAVFNAYGKQITKYQGDWEEKKHEIIDNLSTSGIIYPVREFITEEWTK